MRTLVSLPHRPSRSLPERQIRRLSIVGIHPLRAIRHPPNHKRLEPVLLCLLLRQACFQDERRLELVVARVLRHAHALLRNTLDLCVVAVWGKLEVRVGGRFLVGLEAVKCEGSGRRSLAVAGGGGIKRMGVGEHAMVKLTFFRVSI